MTDEAFDPLDLELCRAAVRVAMHRVVATVDEAKRVMPYLIEGRFADVEIDELLGYARTFGLHCSGAATEVLLARVPVEDPSTGVVILRTKRVLTAAGFLALAERTGRWKPGTQETYRGRTGVLMAKARCYGCQQEQWIPVDATVCYSDWYDRDLMASTTTVPAPKPGRWVTQPGVQLLAIAQVQAARTALGDLMAQHASVCDVPMSDLHVLSERYRQQRSAPTRRPTP